MQSYEETKKYVYLEFCYQLLVDWNYYHNSLIVMNVIILLKAALKKVKLDTPNYWFKDNKNLRGEQTRLHEHEDRILGTLVFWKNNVALYNRLILSRTYWGLISSVLIPILIQYYDNQNSQANIFITILSAWASIITILSLTLQSDEKYRGFRQCESDYYDLARELLDNISNDDNVLNSQVDDFISTASRIRQFGRAIETENAITIRTDRGALKCKPSKDK